MAPQLTHSLPSEKSSNISTGEDTGEKIEVVTSLFCLESIHLESRAGCLPRRLILPHLGPHDQWVPLSVIQTAGLPEIAAQVLGDTLDPHLESFRVFIVST